MVFGSSAQRFKKGLKLFPVIETSADNRIHIHALIDCPDHIGPSEFLDKIDKAWSKTNFGYHHTHIQPIRDDGWSTYITKFNQKSEYDLAIDWMNVRNHNLILNSPHQSLAASISLVNNLRLLCIR